MSAPTWTWPDWRKAPSGARFTHNRSGRAGTYIQPARSAHNGAIVVWDDDPFRANRSPVLADVPGSVYVVAPARELTPTT